MQKKLILSFEQSWILSKREEIIRPVDVFISHIKEVFDITVIDTSLSDCEMVINDCSNGKEIFDKTVALLKKTFGIDDSDGVVSITVLACEDSEAKPDTAEDPQDTKSAEPEIIHDNEENGEIPDASKEKEVEEILKTINTLVGAEEFKALASECATVAPLLLKHGAVTSLSRQTYIFAINDGNGLTTYLKWFAILLRKLGVIADDEKTKIIEDKLRPANDRESAQEMFSAVKAKLRGSFGQKNEQIICIDISEWMTKTTDKRFRDFLTAVEDNLEKNIVIFRVPFVEKEILNGIKRGIGDILSVRDVSFVPFDGAELNEYAKELLEHKGFSMEADAWEVFSARINEEKSDGRFYGVNTVKKVVEEMLYVKYLNNAMSGVDDTIVKKSEILSLADSFGDDQKSGFEMLDGYIGMDTIRTRIQEIVAQIEMSLKNKEVGSPCIHMRFIGNPGTGKTTVARVLGKILKERGVLRNGSFFEYAGRDFCGKFIGETAPKTAAMCRDAYGSVLFIDEAYSLYRSEGSKADYGREAIDTLIAEMENHRNDLVVIMAGYPDEMATLMQANAGLESRMPYVIEFPNYTREQLFEIYMLMVKKAFKCGEGFSDAVKEYFDTLPDEVVLSKEFSNARFVRNLFERTWGKAVLRSQLNKEECTILTKEDFLLASGEKEFKKIMRKPTRTLGFI